MQIRLGSFIELPPHFPRQLLTMVRTAFTHKNKQKQKLKAMGYWSKEPDFYRSYFERDGKIYLYRGAFDRLKSILTENGIDVGFQDDRLEFEPVGLNYGSLELRPNQEPAAKSLVHATQGVLRGATGSGKSETLLGAIIEAQQPTLILVWNKDLLEQWKGRILKYGILDENEIGIIQGSSNKFGLITIGMAQTVINRMEEWRLKFGTVVLDECQIAPCNTMQDILNFFPARYRFGASADEKRRDQKEFLLYDCIGPVVYEMQSLDTVMEPKIYLVDSDYEDADYCTDSNYTQLVNRLIFDRHRNRLISRIISNRLRAGRQVILFTDRVNAAVAWYQEVLNWNYGAGLLVGGVDYKYFVQASIEGIKDGTVQFVAATQYGDVGLDLPTLSTAIVTMPHGSNIKRLNQQVGRVVRPAPGKEIPEVFYIVDRNIDNLSSKTRSIKKKWKNCFDKFTFSGTEQDFCLTYFDTLDALTNAIG